MKAILFDLGQVLIHYDHAQTLAGLAEALPAGVEVHALLAPLLTPLQLGKLDARAFYAELGAKVGPLPGFEAFCTLFCSGMQRNETALAHLLELEERDGLLVGVLSNTNAIHVAWLDEFVPELRRLDLVMMSNEIGLQKPDPAAFRLAVRLLGVRAAETIFVDDLAENVAAARALGMAGIVHHDWAETLPLLEEWWRGE